MKQFRIPKNVLKIDFKYKRNRLNVCKNFEQYSDLREKHNQIVCNHKMYTKKNN